MIQKLRELFVFRGRLARREFWRAYLLLVLLSAIISTVTTFAAIALGAAGGVLFALLLPIIVAGAAITIRRLHDRGRSGWWLLLFNVAPLALSAWVNARGQADPSALVLLAAVGSLGLSLWAFIEIGVLAGTAGANRYGGDPRLASASEVFA